MSESITLTVAEIIDLANFAGIPLDPSKMTYTQDELEYEHTISPCPQLGVANENDDPNCFYRFVVYDAENPEEGCMGLGPELYAHGQSNKMQQDWEREYNPEGPTPAQLSTMRVSDVLGSIPAPSPALLPWWGDNRNVYLASTEEEAARLAGLVLNPGLSPYPVLVALEYVHTTKWMRFIANEESWSPNTIAELAKTRTKPGWLCEVDVMGSVLSQGYTPHTAQELKQVEKDFFPAPSSQVSFSDPTGLLSVPHYKADGTPYTMEERIAFNTHGYDQQLPVLPKVYVDHSIPVLNPFSVVSMANSCAADPAPKLDASFTMTLPDIQVAGIQAIASSIARGRGETVVDTDPILFPLEETPRSEEDCMQGPTPTPD